MLSEEKIWNILEDYFSKYGLVNHQIESFDHFINIGIPKIINSEPDIMVKPLITKNYKSYKVIFDNVYIPSPKIIEESRILRSYYPCEARQRDLTYDSPIYVNVTEIIDIENQEPEIIKHVRVVIGRIPIMLRSSKCYLYSLTPTERIKAGECDHDQGGYFICKGKERVLISQLRGIYNIPLVFNQKQGDKIKYICEMRSMSEETGHSVLIQACIGADDRTLVFVLPYIKEPIHIGIVFRAMGYNDDQIYDIIGSDSPVIYKYIKMIINDTSIVQANGYEHYCESNEGNYSGWSKLTEKEKEDWNRKSLTLNSLKYIGKRCCSNLKDDNNSKEDSTIEDYVLQVINNEIFPHMGISSSIKEKAYLLGNMVKKLLLTNVGTRKIDDRDNYINKRVESPGILCYELFRQLFKKYINTLTNVINNKKQLPDIISIISRTNDITKGLANCFTTSNWGLPKNNYIRPGVAQVLSRLSYGSTISNLRRISIPIGKESKNSLIRQINPSQIMFICPTETPEGGSVGIVLNLALLTSISNRTSTVLMKEILEMTENIILMQNTGLIENNIKVFLNGILLGITEDQYKLLSELKNFKYSNIIPYDISFTYNNIDHEIHIFSDEGRLIRPVFTVNEDKLALFEGKETYDWDELVKNAYITYIDNMEANYSVIGFNQKELAKYKCDYCEISPTMMLGIMASVIPFPDHSPSPRNCFQSAMGKQAMSMFATSYRKRVDTSVHILNEPQKAMINTRSSKIMGFDDMPSGVNCVVAIACYTGFNQEDSIILNYSAVQRGLFWSTTYKTHVEDEKKEGYTIEKISIPPLNIRKNDCNYMLLDSNGIVNVKYPIWYDEKGKKHGGGSVYVEKGDVIIGKIITHTSKNSEQKITDCSLVVKKGEEGYIDRVFISKTPNGYNLVKVVIRKLRIPEIGDKFSSRQAQKGTVGMVYRHEDMPWTQSGIVPDIIINPHCIPSRMTINQLMESVFGKICLLEGEYGDGTPFLESNENIGEKLCNRLGMLGYQRNGNELLMNGMTGEPMGKYFIGPVYYQRLKHLVSEKMHARSTGPITTLTRQPLEGRSRDGGLRFGEMERDCMMGHGTSKFLQERLFLQSDKYKVAICKICGNFATSTSNCSACDSDEVAIVNIPYISKLVFQELNAAMIKTKISVD